MNSHPVESEGVREGATRLESSIEEIAAKRADDALTPEDVAEIQAGIRRGLADAAAGRVRDASAVYARLDALYGVFDIKDG